MPRGVFIVEWYIECAQSWQGNSWSHNNLWRYQLELLFIPQCDKTLPPIHKLKTTTSVRFDTVKGVVTSLHWGLPERLLHSQKHLFSYGCQGLCYTTKVVVHGSMLLSASSHRNAMHLYSLLLTIQKDLLIMHFTYFLDLSKSSNDATYWNFKMNWGRSWNCILLETVLQTFLTIKTIISKISKVFGTLENCKLLSFDSLTIKLSLRAN